MKRLSSIFGILFATLLPAADTPLDIAIGQARAGNCPAAIQTLNGVFGVAAKLNAANPAETAYLLAADCQPRLSGRRRLQSHGPRRSDAVLWSLQDRPRL